MREILLATARGLGELRVLEALDELMVGVCADRKTDCWYAVDCAIYFLELHEESAPAGKAEALLRLRLIADDYHKVLMAEALEEAAAAKESQLS